MSKNRAKKVHFLTPLLRWIRRNMLKERTRLALYHYSGGFYLTIRADYYINKA